MLARRVPGDRRVLLTVGLYHLSNDGAVQVLAGQIVLLSAVFSFGPFQTGVLVSTSLLVNAVCQVILGVLSDRRDPSRFLPIGVAILGGASLLMALCTSFVMLLLVVALARAGASFFHPVGMAWVGREFHGAQLDRSMGIQSGTGDAGEILGMATGAGLGSALGWQSPFLLWGAIDLAAVVLGIVMSRRLRAPPPAVARTTWRDLTGSLWDVRAWVLPLAVGSVSYNVMSYFGPLLLNVRFGFGSLLAGLSVAAWLLVGTATALGFGRLSRRFGRFPLTVFAYASVGTACILAAVLANVVLVLVVLLSLGAGLFLTYPALFSFVSERSHAKLQGAAFGFVFFFQLLGGAVGSFSAGAITTLFPNSPDLQAAAPFWLAGVVSLLTAGYLVGLRARRGDRVASAAPAHTPP